MNPIALVTRGYISPQTSSGGPSVITGMAPEVSGGTERPVMLVDELSAPRSVGVVRTDLKPVIKPKTRK